MDVYVDGQKLATVVSPKAQAANVSKVYETPTWQQDLHTLTLVNSKGDTATEGIMPQ